MLDSQVGWKIGNSALVSLILNKTWKWDWELKLARQAKRRYLKNSLVTFNKVLLVQAEHNSGILGCKRLLGTTCSILGFTLQSQTYCPSWKSTTIRNSTLHGKWDMLSKSAKMGLARLVTGLAYRPRHMGKDVCWCDSLRLFGHSVHIWWRLNGGCVEKGGQQKSLVRS